MLLSPFTGSQTGNMSKKIFKDVKDVVNTREELPAANSSWD
jgi:hypothetical protein